MAGYTVQLDAARSVWGAWQDDRSTLWAFTGDDGKQTRIALSLEATLAVVKIVEALMSQPPATTEIALALDADGHT